jgi:DNA-binding response OmpR family regulator
VEEVTVSPASNKKILLVEDDGQLRQAIRICLESLAYSVCEAGTGAEALALAGSQQPDLILLNLGLPDRDGLEVAQELRRRPATTRIPIAIFTGQPVVGRRAEVVGSICIGTIYKPVTLQRLVRDLTLLLAMRRSTSRRFPRYPLEAQVWWRVRGGSEGDEADYDVGMARSLSEGGVMVELPAPVPVASLLDLRLAGSTGDVDAVGKVVWTRHQEETKTRVGSYKHGVQFMDMGPAARAAIQLLVEGIEPAIR